MAASKENTEPVVVPVSIRGGKREGAGMKPSIREMERIRLATDASQLLALYAKKLRDEGRIAKQGDIASEILAHALRELMPDAPNALVAPPAKPQRKPRKPKLAPVTEK